MKQRPSRDAGYRGAAATALKGYLRLYETQLKAERKAAKTIEAYFYVLGKFQRWLDAEQGRAGVLGDVTAPTARTFLVAAQEKNKHSLAPGSNSGEVTILQASLLLIMNP